MDPEESEGPDGEQSPDSEATSSATTGLTLPFNAVVALNVLSDGAIADADADQVADSAP